MLLRDQLQGEVKMAESGRTIAVTDEEQGRRNTKVVDLSCVVEETRTLSAAASLGAFIHVFDWRRDGTQNSIFSDSTTP